MTKIAKTSLVKIKKLWNENKHAQWDCGGLGGIYAADFLPNGWWFNNESESIPENYLEAAENHYNTILHWRKTLSPFKGNENNIPDEYAIIYVSGSIEDGMHRLTAAYIEGLESFPVMKFKTLGAFLHLES